MRPMRAAAITASTSRTSEAATTLTRNQIISELTRSPHGDLNQYLPTGRQAAISDPEFLAHLIAWNHDKGQIRDSKVALPVVMLSVSGSEGHTTELVDNSLAHLALLDPRNLVRALQFAWEIKTPGYTRSLHRLVERYLRTREAIPPWWEKTALAHRASLKTLYARFHIKPAAYCDLALMKGQPAPGSLLAAVRDLPKLPAVDAARLITERKIPFLIALGSLGARIKEPDLLTALIARMSPTELVTNAALLEKAGVRNQPETRAAFEAKLAEAASGKKLATTFKAGKAAASLTNDSLRAKVSGLQERQIQSLGGVEGNWLVLGDMSGSMQQSIEISKLVASTLAHSVKGQVHLIFFNQEPRYFDVTGKTHEEIIALTRYITANGGTSIGCGLQYLLDHNIEVDGIAIVSDGGEHGSPLFSQVYPKYSSAFGKEVPVYHYLVSGSDPNTFAAWMAQAHYDVQVLNLLGGVDYYSLPNLILTMRTQRYSLADEIMQTPLLTLDEAFKAQTRSTH